MDLFKRSIFALLLICLIQQATAQTNQTILTPQRFKISSIPETNYVPLNKKFTVKVEIIYQGFPGQYVISEPYIEKLHNLELIATSVENIVESVSTNTNIKLIKRFYIYTLSPKSLGLAYFPKITVAIADKKGNPIEQLETPAVPINIIEPVYPRDYSTLYVILISISVIIIFGVLILYLMKRYKLKKEAERKRLEELEKARIPMEDEYIKALLKKEEQIKEATQFYDESIKLLKEYLEEKFDIKIREKSTAEIISLVSSIEDLNENQIELLKSILEESDIVKYAQETVDASKKNRFKEKLKEFFQNNIKSVKSEPESEKS